MNIHLARQPIFDRALHVYGYELLYRQNDVYNAYEKADANPDEASSKVVLDSFYGIGIERLTGGKRAFINFTSNLLTQDIATLLPSSKLVIEILEDVSPEPHVLEKCRQLRDANYQIALDDFVFSEGNLPLIDVADIIKIDFLQTPLQQIEWYVSQFQRPHLHFLAEKVESRAMFDLAVKMGFSYFQGFFFSRPVILTGRTVQPLNVNYVRLLKEINKPILDFKTIARTIMQDVSLSYRLLRMVNSVAFGFIYPIKTVLHALVALGSKEIKKWISLIVMMGINENQPEELLRLSLVRAKMAEELSRICQKDAGDNLFIMGLFSLMDVIMSRSFVDVFRDVSVSDEVRDVLVAHAGPYVPVFDLVLAHERGDWETTNEMAESCRLTPENVTECYLVALRWCNAIFLSDAIQSS